MSKQFFIRSARNPSRVAGPFGLKKLQELVIQGKLKPTHEVSLDQKKWASASKIKPSLFDDSDKTPKASPAPVDLGSLDLDSLVDAPIEESAASDDWAPIDYTQKARVPGSINLIDVQKYVPSGKCDKPWMILLTVPIGILVGAVVVPLGIGLSAWLSRWMMHWGMHFMIAFSQLSGSIPAFIRGLLSLGNGADFKPEEVVAKYALFGHHIGAGFGSLSSFLACFIAVLLFEKWSIDRSRYLKLVVGFLTGLCLLGLMVLLGEVIRSQIELDSTTFWVCSGIVFLGCLIGAAMCPNSPFCETCHSFLEATHVSTYTARGDKLANLAIEGNVNRLQRAKKLKEEPGMDQDHTRVTLSTCDKKCCSHITMQFFAGTSDDEEKANELQSVRFQQQDIDLSMGHVFADGFLNKEQTAAWKRLLDPVKKP